MRRSFTRNAVLVALATLGVGISGLAGQAFADETTPAVDVQVRPHPSVPAVIAPPAGSVKVAEYQVARGVQIYTCTAGAWVFKAPEATLVASDRSRRSIHHFAGPSWQSNEDGSLVVGAKRAESPVPGSIAQLLLEVTSHSGRGQLSRVSYIQRLYTSGGVSPTGSCVDGATAPVPYRATYVFWATP